MCFSENLNRGDYDEEKNSNNEGRGKDNGENPDKIRLDISAERIA